MFFNIGRLASLSCLVASAYGVIVDENDEPIFGIARKGGWESPEYSLLFRKPLPIPPVKQPKMIIPNPVTGKDIWYYELEEKSFQKQIYPNLRPTTFVGYDGIAPGPTFQVPVGTETVVRIINSAQLETSVHLHGSPSRAPFDGWAEDLTFPGQYKDYYWPNFQSARLLWYHDHAVHITAVNANSGLAGAYILSDPKEDALGLPSGYGKYDIPLILTSRFYNADGSVKSPENEDREYPGDIIHVNGEPWPFMNVEPRKYRFRILNAAVSRSWNLYLADLNALNVRIPFQVIASDSGLLEKPVSTTDLYVGIAERWEIVVDFSRYAGKTIDIRQVAEANDVAVDDEYEHTDKTMRFIVSSTPVQDPSHVPDVLREVPFPPANSAVTRHFKFERSNGQWLIDGVGFAQVENRVLAKPAVGTVETWELENSSGGWSHPVHIHLVDFKVVKRTGGRGKVMPYEAAGLKDVVWLGRGETLTIEAHYIPWTGVYMWHCHNLIHEDKDMMAVFNVTALDGLGYDEVTDYSDPMDPRWRAVPVNRAEFTGRTGAFTEQSITDRILALAREQPYSQLDEALEAFEGNEKRDTSPIPRYRRYAA
jgi:bilirubin oxidase